jgi:hypothetical protein
MYPRFLRAGGWGDGESASVGPSYRGSTSERERRGERVPVDDDDVMFVVQKLQTENLRADGKMVALELVMLRGQPVSETDAIAVLEQLADEGELVRGAPLGTRDGSVTKWGYIDPRL